MAVERKAQVIGLGLILLILYSAYVYALPYVKHLMLMQEVDRQVNWDIENLPAPLDSHSMRENILTKAQNLGLPLKSAGVNVDVHDRFVRISVRYGYPVSFFGLRSTLSFDETRTTRSGLLPPT